jgi:TolB-like protein/Tfp pilus assembly protein PilF
LVLILSDHAVASAHVGKELERASSKGHPVLALRIHSPRLTPAFEYFLNESQWIEGGDGASAAAIAQLADAVRRHLIPLSAPESGSAQAPPDGRGAHARGGQPPAAASVFAAGRRKVALIAALVIMVAATAFIAADKLRPHQRVDPAAPSSSIPPARIGDRSIAVLPFTDMSEKKDQEYFADGMAEEILDLLVQIPGLKVIGRTSSFQFKGKTGDLRSIGTALGANYVLEGSVRKAADRVRITAQLIDTQDGTRAWSGAYDRDFGDVLTLQHDIALGIARALQVAVGADESQKERNPVNAEAYTLYLRGRFAADRGDDAGFQEAQADFTQALALDPSFVQAAEELANAYAGHAANEFVPSGIGWQRAREAAEHALRLDPHSAAGHGVLGMRLALYEFDLAAADAEMALALKSRPRDPLVLTSAARLAGIRGRFDAGLRLVNAALTVDPLNPYLLQTQGYIQYYSGRLPAAEAALRRSIEISSTFSANHFGLGQILLAQGRPDAALEEMKLISPDDGRDAGLAMVYHALGRRRESDLSLEQATRRFATNWAYGIAQVHAYRGDRDGAFHWLDTALAQRDPDLQLVKADPLLNNLHGDPRFGLFLRRMHLAD